MVHYFFREILMKTRWTVTLLLIACLTIMTGCSKKEEPVKTPAEPDTTETAGMMDTMKEAATEKVDQVAEAAKETVEAVKESFTMDINLDKAVADLKAEAAKMDVKTLTEVALKYKDAILEKQGQLDGLIQKLKAVPMTEKLGAEAQGMTADIKALTDAIAPLKERFGVYVDAIKAKGGNVKDLML